MPERTSVADLARTKALPEDALRGFGVTDVHGGGVREEYLSPDGAPVRDRFRWTPGGLNSSTWEERDLPRTAYWRPFVPGLARDRGYLLLCEGESSCWTAWHHGVAAVGFPGADHIGVLGAGHLAGADVIGVIVEPDDPDTYPRGADHYRDQVLARLAQLGLPDAQRRVVVLDLTGTAADLVELHRQDPQQFPARLGTLLDDARETRPPFVQEQR
ncbi:hypothetical protein [Mangrovihabitans endophyticus]|uniref:hypothetical protein n=1 Tax=Mangrovihabitans endophyticus TaxID=1751298 RepID=UPI00166BA490|nr:hypothetical protein [Mangrovihabitans endophyticus]